MKNLNLPPLELIQAEQCKRSFYRFIKDAWSHVEATDYVDGWHIELIAKALQKLVEGGFDGNSLYINIPPSSMKTLLCAVMFPAWIWTRDPAHRFICVSYSEKLENKSARKMRNLVTSKWYQERFKDVRISDDSNQISEYSNTKGGVRYSVGVGGSLTGRHGSIIMDDLLSVSDATSEIEMERVNTIYDDTISSRLENPKKSFKLILCQRINTGDIVGHLNEKKEPYDRIILPEEYEGQRYFSKYPELNDPRKELGELLWPQRRGVPEVLRIKQTLSTLGWSGQYQQRPSPVGGTIFKKEWFVNRFENTDVAGRIISIDTSFGKNKTSDYSSIVVGEFTYDYKIFIREVYRGKLEFPQLLMQIEEMALKYKFRLKKILIESKASGISVMQTLNQSSARIQQIERELGIMSQTLICPIAPIENKTARAQLVSPWCEKGMVVLPPPNELNASWLYDFEEEIFAFPQVANDDQTDAFTQLIQFCAPKMAYGIQIMENKLKELK
jgi:predicted phage terminase large subunit-like protein